MPHSNHDNEKDEVRTDSYNAPLFVIRLLLSLLTFFGFCIASAHIKGAFLQSGLIQIDIYVRPPRHRSSIRGILWKLLKPPYGIADAGRQWEKVVEKWMLSDAGLERIFGISQLFANRDKQGNICLLVSKFTGNFLLGGSIQQMKYFIDVV